MGHLVQRLQGDIIILLLMDLGAPRGTSQKGILLLRILTLVLPQRSRQHLEFQGFAGLGRGLVSRSQRIQSTRHLESQPFLSPTP